MHCSNSRKWRHRQRWPRWGTCLPQWSTLHHERLARRFTACPAYPSLKPWSKAHRGTATSSGKLASYGYGRSRSSCYKFTLNLQVQITNSKSTKWPVDTTSSSSNISINIKHQEPASTKCSITCSNWNDQTMTVKQGTCRSSADISVAIRPMGHQDIYK
jgi:hypothetical protein